MLRCIDIKALYYTIGVIADSWQHCNWNQICPLMFALLLAFDILSGIFAL